MTWKKTHIIRLETQGNRQEIDVMLDDGRLYTEEEWAAGVPADWEITGEGVILFQGQRPQVNRFSWMEAEYNP